MVCDLGPDYRGGKKKACGAQGPGACKYAHIRRFYGVQPINDGRACRLDGLVEAGEDGELATVIAQSTKSPVGVSVTKLPTSVQVIFIRIWFVSDMAW